MLKKALSTAKTCLVIFFVVHLRPILMTLQI